MSAKIKYFNLESDLRRTEEAISVWFESGKGNIKELSQKALKLERELYSLEKTIDLLDRNDRGSAGLLAAKETGCIIECLVLAVLYESTYLFIFIGASHDGWEMLIKQMVIPV